MSKPSFSLTLFPYIPLGVYGMTSVTIIDNVDPSIIFAGVWTRHDSKTGYNNTISLTRRIGNSATVNFTGNSIAVYGMLGPHPPDAPAITSYQIDNGSPTTYAPTSPSTQVTRLLFYQSPTLSYGLHRLVMTNMVDLDWIWLDYFEVTSTGSQPQPPEPPRTSGSITTRTPASAGNAPQTTVSTGDSTSSPASSATSGPTKSSNLSSNTLDQSLSSARTPSASNTDQSQFFSPKTTHIAPKTTHIDTPTFLALAQGGSNSTSTLIGAIVGGGLGGAMLLAIIALVLIFFRLKKKKRETRRDINHEASESDLIQHNPSRTSQSYLTREMPLREDGQGHIGSSNAERTFLSPPPSADVGPWVLPPSKAGLQVSRASASPEVPAGLPPHSA